MKLEDLYPGNKALVLKKVEDQETAYIVSGKGAATAVICIPGAVKVGDHVVLTPDETGNTLIFDKVAAPVEPAPKSTRGQGCFLGEKVQQHAVN